jgi:hypothetical protein
MSAPLRDANAAVSVISECGVDLTTFEVSAFRIACTVN